MADNNQFFEDILHELSFRSSEGYPNFSKPEHITLLSEILTDWGLTDVKYELIKNLLKEKDEKPLDAREKERAEKMGLKWLGKGYGKDDGKGITHKNVDGKLVKLDKDGKEEPEKDTTKLTSKDFDYTKDKKKEEPKKSDYESVVASSKQKVKELYGEDGGGELLQKSKTSNDALKNGYVKGADWVAPGNAGSNFNENISNEGALILEKYPDLSEDELVNILFEKTKNSELGKQQKKTTIDGSDKGNVPEEIPTTDRDLYRNCIITARSARSKYNRAKKAKEAALSQVEFGSDTTTMAFGGTSSDLDNLANEIDSANKVFVHDAGTNKVYEIPKDVMKDWVAGSGGGENPSDTAVLTKDENGNIIYDGWSDKKGLSDIQGNSTLNDDFSKADGRVDILTESGKVDADTASQAKTIIKNAQAESNDIEQGYKNAVYKEGQYLSGYEESKKDELASLLKLQDEGYQKEKTKNHVQNLMKKTGSKTHREALDKLLEGSVNEKLTADERKVLFRLAEVERENIKASGSEIPAGLDTKKILSDARDKALDRQRQTVDELNELTGRTSSGKEKPLGDLLGFQETVDFLHLDKIETPSDESDHKQILKRNTHLVMGGIDVPADNIKGCLGVDDLNDYEDNFEIVNEEKIIKDRSGSITTGKVVYIYAVNKDGVRKFVGEKRYRSKEGATGKTSNTIQWSSEMQNCFDRKK